MKLIQAMADFQRRNLVKLALWSLGFGICAGGILDAYGNYMAETGILGTLNQANKAGVLDDIVKEIDQNILN